MVKPGTLIRFVRPWKGRETGWDGVRLGDTATVMEPYRNVGSIPANGFKCYVYSLRRTVNVGGAWIGLGSHWEIVDEKA